MCPHYCSIVTECSPRLVEKGVVHFVSDQSFRHHLLDGSSVDQTPKDQIINTRGY
jgi:hypothetical protein